MKYLFTETSGWGNTGKETSIDKLQETVVPIVQTSLCVERMNHTAGDEPSNLILCAGGGSEGPCKVIFNKISLNINLNVHKNLNLG